MRRTLIGSYRRYEGHENKVTELLALALETFVPFASKLFADVFSESVGQRDVNSVSVICQVLAEGRYPDMEVRAFDAQGHLTKLIWSENKLDAIYQPDQLKSYAHSLSALERPAERQLITIVKRRDRAAAQAAEVGVPVFTWSDVARMALQAGQEHSGPHWRLKALEPLAEARLRILEEFIQYLEGECGVTSEPVRAEHIDAFRLANETFERLWALIERSGELARDRGVPAISSGQMNRFGYRTDWGKYAWTFSPGPLWMEATGGESHLVAFADDHWMPEPRGEPVIGVGISWSEGEGIPDDPKWQRRLQEDGFVFGRSADVGKIRLYRPIRLRDMPTEEMTLERQAQWLADRTVDAFVALEKQRPELPDLLTDL